MTYPLLAMALNGRQWFNDAVPKLLCLRRWARTAEHDENAPLERLMIFKRLLAQSLNGSTTFRVFRPCTYLEAGYGVIIGPIATSTSASTFEIGLPIARPQCGGCNKIRLTSLSLGRNYPVRSQSIARHGMPPTRQSRPG
jgi:hypothetical protein